MKKMRNKNYLFQIISYQLSIKNQINTKQVKVLKHRNKIEFDLKLTKIKSKRDGLECNNSTSIKNDNTKDIGKKNKNSVRVEIYNKICPDNINRENKSTDDFILYMHNF